MTVPSIDIENFAVELLPYDQRLPNWIIFAKSLPAPNKRVNQLFEYMVNGSTDMGYWSATATYSKGDLVRDLSGVYESKYDSNTGNAITGDSWRKVLNSFIGVTERSKYTGRYLTFTWALNRIFGTTFRQPPYPSPYGPGGTYSDIYITTDAIVNESFVMFPASTDSSKMFPTSSTGYMFPSPIYAATSTYKFTVFFPAAVYTALGADAATREATARQYIDPLTPSGTQYTISTY